MDKQFTASEVRRLSNRIPRSNDKIADAQEALRAFADLLEAWEKAVPVMVVNHVSSAEHDLPMGMKLYTHPSPSDAERLAEALRAFPEDPNPFTYRRCYANARAALAAQAQPPATRVTDEMVRRLKRALPLFCADVTMADARAALEAALAAQENPNG